MAEKSWHLITYDIRNPRRLRKVAKKLEGYGERIQYSVFRCRLDKVALEKLCWELAQIMKENDDLLVMPICSGCAERVPLHSTGDQSSWAARPPSFKIV
jgi:CRISPR-associated protein Cas2